jgi:hypothetical protein
MGGIVVQRPFQNSKIVFNLKYILKSNTLYHGLFILRIERRLFENVVFQLKTLT